MADWQWFAAAHADGRRERRERERDDDRSERSSTSSGSSGASTAASSGSSSGGGSMSAVTSSAPSSTSSAASGAAARANDSSDRFGSESVAARDGFAGRPATRQALPDSVRDMATARAARRDNVRNANARPTREIVAIRPQPRAMARAKALGFSERGRSDRRSPVARLVVPDGLDVVTAKDMLLRELPGERFGVNHTYRSYRSATNGWKDHRNRPASSEPCPPDRCFGPTAIRWRSPLSSCAQALRVGVIDTSVDFTHPAFARKRFVTRTFAVNPSPKVNSAHGTGILSLLAAQPHSGTPGLIPAADFYVADVFGTDTTGQPITDTASLVEALDWMQRNNVRVINASVAGPSDEVLKDKIQELAGRGILVVAAAGNEGPNGKPVYPAAYPEVIAVTAVDRRMHGYRQANHGAYIDVAAPGVDIWTAVPDGKEGYQTGTSFAVPYVTALAATLLMPGEQALKPDILKRLKTVDLGPRGRDSIYGLGAAIAPQACGARAIASTSGWTTHVMRVLPKGSVSSSNFSLAGAGGN
jgi:hypothetical protein